ncbi:MAG: hypothetical protein ACK2U1_13345 [Anaerolineales bacterium]
MNRKPVRIIEKLIGWTTSFCLIVGFLALLGAIAAFFSGDYAAVGLNLIAAALGFGLFSVAVLNG